MKKIMLFLILGVFFISFASAEVQTLGTFKLGNDINLIQQCASCTFNNVTSVLLPDSSAIISGNFSMTRVGSDYNFTLFSGNATSIGRYIVNGIGDLDGVNKEWNYDFFITPSGFSDTFEFYIIILLISAVVIIFGFWIRDPWVVIFGTFGLYFTGLYIIINGIVGIKDMITTWAIGLVLLGIASYISIKTSIEVMNG